MDKNVLPVQSVIRTFLGKKLWRPVSLFPVNCMDKLLLNADKNADKWGSDFAKPATARDCVAGSTGLEPAASGVTGRRSNQTELRPPASGDLVGDTRIELVTYGL